MKYRLLFPAWVALFIFSGSLNSWAQIVHVTDTCWDISTIQEKAEKAKAMPNSKQPYEHVEQMPTFPGGEKALYQWLIDNLQYPKELADVCIQGRVVIRFVVTADGSIEKVEVLRSLHPLLDAEAVRVAQAMPKWNQGKRNDEPVSVYYTLPIAFKVQVAEDTTKTDSISKTTEAKKHVEVMPQFIGGEKIMFLWLSNNLHYPEDAQRRGIQGRVIVRFVVDVDGSIKQVEVVRSLSPSCDAEAVRAVKAMPDWSPGTQDGIPVPVYFTLPLSFKLQRAAPTPTPNPNRLQRSIFSNH
jgi:TonB family protein